MEALETGSQVCDSAAYSELGLHGNAEGFASCGNREEMQREGSRVR